MTTICVAVLMREVLTSISPSTAAEQPRAELGDGMYVISFFIRYRRLVAS